MHPTRATARERPPQAAASDAPDEFAAAVRAGTLTADELLTRYVTIAYHRTGSYEETARRLALDRRTVKAKIDATFLDRLRGHP
jgi:hypothetical protein